MLVPPTLNSWMMAPRGRKVNADSSGLDIFAFAFVSRLLVDFRAVCVEFCRLGHVL